MNYISSSSEQFNFRVSLLPMNSWWHRKLCSKLLANEFIYCLCQSIRKGQYDTFTDPTDYYNQSGWGDKTPFNKSNFHHTKSQKQWSNQYKGTKVKDLCMNRCEVLGTHFSSIQMFPEQVIRELYPIIIILIRSYLMLSISINCFIPQGI